MTRPDKRLDLYETLVMDLLPYMTDEEQEEFRRASLAAADVNKRIVELMKRGKAKKGEKARGVITRLARQGDKEAQDMLANRVLELSVYVLSDEQIHTLRQRKRAAERG